MERLTPEYLESQIARETYVRPEGCGTLMICVLTMRNGLHITGESACLNPADFDAALGEKYARQNAFSKLWQLEGYARASLAAHFASKDAVYKFIRENRFPTYAEYKSAVEQFERELCADTAVASIDTASTPTVYVTAADVREALRADALREDAKAALEKLFGDIRVGGTD